MSWFERSVDVVHGAIEEFAEFMAPVVAIGGTVFLLWQVFIR